jgi:hypothetical protein
LIEGTLAEEWLQQYYSQKGKIGKTGKLKLFPHLSKNLRDALVSDPLQWLA